ncbi:MAG TPA: DUF5719 family protein [Trebonia sp.]|nr:DUF5719 family protein [Trebonia sp.]
MTRGPAVPLRAAAPGAAVLALAIVFVIAWATQPGAARVAAPGSRNVAVTSITRSCPPAAPGATAPQVSMIALPAASSVSASFGPAAAQPAAAPAGQATFSGILAAPAAGSAPAAGKKSPAGKKPSGGKTSSAPIIKPVTVTAPGTLTTVAAPGGGGAAVAATGQMAEGFEAEQTDASGTGVVSCTHPGSDMWFVGTGEANGASQVWLYLMNTGNIAASADVTILTDTGQQNALASAITVNPNQFVPENITPYVRSSQAVALHVQAGTGQVAAAVWEGGQGGGAWLPQASAPATSLVIPGLTVASSAAKLFVVVPGASDAKVNVVAYTPAGASPQFPGAPVDATAGAATPLVLNSLGASAAGLKLTSNVPIVAGVLVPGAGIGSFTTAVRPVTEQGVVAASPAGKGVTVGLLLTAPSAAARASISVISADGTVTTAAGDQNVTVGTGHTLAVVIPRPSGAGQQPFAIVVTPRPGSGPLYAARVVTSGAGGLSAPLSSLLPVSSAMTSIALPAARNSYTAVLP